VSELAALVAALKQQDTQIRVRNLYEVYRLAPRRVKTGCFPWSNDRQATNGSQKVANQRALEKSYWAKSACQQWEAIAECPALALDRLPRAVPDQRPKMELRKRRFWGSGSSVMPMGSGCGGNGSPMNAARGLWMHRRSAVVSP
jgi:hypothetical protein